MWTRSVKVTVENSIYSSFARRSIADNHEDKGGFFDSEAELGDNEFDYDWDPETVPHLFEGDIALSHPQLRLGVNVQTNTNLLWPEGVIPYRISPLYEMAERRAIEEAIASFNLLTCVKFVPHDGEEEDYIVITPAPSNGPNGCWSYIGRTGGEQTVSLEPPTETSRRCFSGEGRIMHELMHTIGIYHEQSRDDRDEYIQINWENIMPNNRKNFRLIPWRTAQYVFDYDYNSVMHYGEYYFSKRKGEKPSITPLKEGVTIGQRRMMSRTDCLKINELYGCLSGRKGKIYKSFCKILDIFFQN